MANFLTFLTSLLEYFWLIVKNITIDSFNIMKELDKFLFNYTSSSTWLIITFILSKHLPTIFSKAIKGIGGMKKPAQQPQIIQQPGAVPIQQGGSILANIAQKLATDPILRQQVAQRGEAALQNPQIQQQLANVAQSVPLAIPTAQPAPVVQQPVLQQPVLQPIQQPVIQPVIQPTPIVQQPIVQPVAQPKFKQRITQGAKKIGQGARQGAQAFRRGVGNTRRGMIRIRKVIQTDKRSKLITFLMLLAIFYYEHADECRKQTGGNIDIKSMLRSGFWTIGFSYIITIILTNIGPYRMVRSLMGENIATDIIDGIVLYFVYNLVRNFRNITKKNTCEMSEATKKAKEEAKKEEEKTENFTEFEEEKKLRQKSQPTMDELKREALREQQDKDELKRSNNTPTVEDKIPEAQRILKDADIIVGRQDIFRAIDRLLQEQKEINLENLKELVDVESPKQVLSVEDQGKVKSLPKDRRRAKGYEVEEAEKVYSISPFAEKRAVQKIDDAFIRSEGGRLIGVNLEKAMKIQNDKLIKLGYK